jgi:hypothetical protein
LEFSADDSENWRTEMSGRKHRFSNFVFVATVSTLIVSSSCAPRIVAVSPTEGAPETLVNVSMEYLVGWPRIEVGKTMMDWPQLKLIATDATRSDVPGEELIWIEDKVLQFQIPDLPPGEYDVTIHDDKGPPMWFFRRYGRLCFVRTKRNLSCECCRNTDAPRKRDAVTG